MKVSEIEVGGVYGDGKGRYRLVTRIPPGYRYGYIECGVAEAHGPDSFRHVRCRVLTTREALAKASTARDNHPPKALLDALEDRP